MTDRYNLVVLSDVNTCDRYRNTKDFRIKRNPQIVFDHRVKTRGLLRLIIAIDDSFFDTAVHEYTHAVIFSQHVFANYLPGVAVHDEESWLNEAIAHVVEDQRGYGWGYRGYANPYYGYGVYGGCWRTVRSFGPWGPVWRRVWVCG